ncbi:MAG: tryptophan--tRNA ligase [Oscillospiraceae bacterium]|jgi:tryptophanyl-tRNA synthetase|nr:tryptophan--tRNA ligase [Oscillospiraceae bacterium]
MKNKKIVFSGIQPTSTPHLGNYLGALKNWVAMQDDYDCVYCVADLHAITVRQDPAKLRKQTAETYALLMAMGIDTEKSVLFTQGHNPRHAELAWVLSCYTPFGELSRMTQFKDKSEKHSENINAGLFTYPVLQAADILLYQADLVPVGADQKQHLELSRDAAARFNNAYGETFTLPEPYIPKTSAKIMSLSEPSKKMSKSDGNPNACIGVLDDRDAVIRKFRRAVTDSGAEVVYRENDADKAGINNLILIYSAVTGKTAAETEKEFAGGGYGEFKSATGEVVADMFKPVREEYARITADDAFLVSRMRDGAEKAVRVSEKTLKKVYKKVGFLGL